MNNPPIGSAPMDPATPRPRDPATVVPSDPATAVVEVSGLVVAYGGFTAVQGIDFTIPKGALFGFIGPNGAGKSSTIRVLATLQKPTRGTVRIAGLNVATQANQVRRRIGYVPDSFGVYDDLTVREYLHFFAAAYEVPRADRERLIGDALALTDLEGKRTSPVEGLSRGMKQRLALARVLLHDPELLLLDEPASGLDPRARIEFRELLKELQRLGKTILVSSHILHELAQLCTHLGIIEAGKMVAHGELGQIMRRLDVKRSVHVQMAETTDALVAAITRINGVTAVERLPDRLAIAIREHDLPVEDLHAALVAAGARIRMFQPEAADVEMAFMKLTEGIVR